MARTASVLLLSLLNVLAAPVSQAQSQQIPARQAERVVSEIALERARQRAYGVTAESGSISAASHECVPLVINCGQTGAGEITSHDCSTDSGVYVDFVFFNASAGQTITANLSSPSFNPYLILFDPDSSIVADDDDSGPGDAARIVHLIDETSNLWSLAATPLESFVFGNYVLSLACSGAPPSGPAAPSNLTAQAISSTSAQLAWRDNSASETSFRIELRSAGGTFFEIGSVAANVTTVTVEDLTPGSTVDFRVRARNSSGNSSYSNLATVTLPGSGDTSPCVPDAFTLCIDDQAGDRRFEARLGYTNPQGSGSAHAVPLASLGVTRGGLFWIGNPANPEMLIKVLNACVPSLGNTYWVFYAATTNQGLVTQVRDTATGRVWSRSNSQGSAAAPVQDTNAFPCD